MNFQTSNKKMLKTKTNYANTVPCIFQPHAFFPNNLEKKTLLHHTHKI
jgi:hypothetical protein